VESPQLCIHGTHGHGVAEMAPSARDVRRLQARPEKPSSHSHSPVLVLQMPCSISNGKRKENTSWVVARCCTAHTHTLHEHARECTGARAVKVSTHHIPCSNTPPSHVLCPSLMARPTTPGQRDTLLHEQSHGISHTSSQLPQAHQLLQVLDRMCADTYARCNRCPCTLPSRCTSTHCQQSMFRAIHNHLFGKQASSRMI